jgi:hypothetical protein
LIGDVETVAEKLVGEIRATHPVHMCFSFKVGATPRFPCHVGSVLELGWVMRAARTQVAFSCFAADRGSRE